MSTLLQLFQDTKRECKIPGTVPTTAQSQTGMLGDLVAWVIKSWNDVQLKEMDWKWMHSTFTLPTVASTRSYAYGSCTDVRASALITRFARWQADKTVNRWKIYLQSAGVATQNELIHISYDQYQFLYMLGANQQIIGYPVHVAIDPQDNILLGPNPNAVYVVTGEYYRSRQVLSADIDTPEMPAQFHDLIVFEAMRKYAKDQSAPELLDRALGEIKTYYSRLRGNQLPKTRWRGPLA